MWNFMWLIQCKHKFTKDTRRINTFTYEICKNIYIDKYKEVVFSK